MLSQQKIIETLKKEFPYLRDNFAVKKIGIFGSYAKGLQNKESDIDIVVEFKKQIGLKFIDLSDHLEKILNKKVDILTLTGIKGIRIKEIARDIERNISYV